MVRTTCNIIKWCQIYVHLFQIKLNSPLIGHFYFKCVTKHRRCIVICLQKCHHRHHFLMRNYSNMKFYLSLSNGNTKSHLKKKSMWVPLFSVFVICLLQFHSKFPSTLRSLFQGESVHSVAILGTHLCSYTHASSYVIERKIQKSLKKKISCQTDISTHLNSEITSNLQVTLKSCIFQVGQANSHVQSGANECEFHDFSHYQKSKNYHKDLTMTLLFGNWFFYLKDRLLY